MPNLLNHLEAFEKQTFIAGEHIIKQDENSRVLYILLSGQVGIVGEHGIHISQISKAGSLIGELSALLNIPRTASVQARSLCECVVIDDVQALFKQHNDVALSLIKQSLERLNILIGALLQFKQQFLQTINSVSLNIEYLPLLQDYMHDWDEIQNQLSSAYPFILQTQFSAEYELNLEAGQILIEEGEYADAFYVLKHGKTEQTRRDNAFYCQYSQTGTVLNIGTQLVCASLATITATETTKVSVIEDVSNLLSNDKLGLELLSQIAERIVQYTDIYVKMKSRFLSMDNNIAPIYRQRMQKVVSLMQEQEKRIPF